MCAYARRVGLNAVYQSVRGQMVQKLRCIAYFMGHVLGMTFVARLPGLGTCSRCSNTKGTVTICALLGIGCIKYTTCHTKKVKFCCMFSKFMLRMCRKSLSIIPMTRTKTDYNPIHKNDYKEITENFRFLPPLKRRS